MIEEILKLHSKEIDKVKKCLKNIEKIEVRPSLFTGVVGAVDSGFYTVRLGRMVFMRIKVRGVMFSYKNGKVVDYKKIGKGFEDLTLYIEEEEESDKVSLERIKREIDMINKLKDKVDLLFFDGSFLKIKKKFGDVLRGIDDFAVAIAKTSSSQLLTKRCNTYIGDQIALNYFLKEGESTEPIVVDGLNVAYAKFGNNLPIRIEGKSYDLSVIASLCGKKYGYPFILTEADRVARIRKPDILDVKRSIRKLKFIRRLR